MDSLRILAISVLAGASVGSLAQALPMNMEASTSGSASGSSNGAGPAGIIPHEYGFNASLGTSSQHDSSNGWSSTLTPGIAYRFNAFSVNATIPIYTYVNVLVNKGTKAKPVYVQEAKKGVPGDTALAAQLELHRTVDYTASISLGLPTGNKAYGLGGGQVTYDFNNHFERGVGMITPNIEAGIGDSSSLLRTRVRRSYTAVGTLAHFQVGAAMDLPFNASFEADAYEELPVAASTIYSSTGKGKKKVTTALGPSASEDNGFSTTLDIPLNGHVTLSGFYNRSLRSRDDVAGFSFTFLLKAPPRHDDVH